MPRERTYIMIKPDGVQRGLVGKIIARFEEKGFKLVAMKMAQPSREHLEKHYEDLKTKKFFPGLITYMLSGPVVCMVWEGDDAVKTGRVMLGATKPSDSVPGSIRGDMCIHVGRNICHGSDSVESANKEIALWFGSELCTYRQHSEAWVYEDSESGPILLGMGNPLLDISAVVPQGELDKWGAQLGNAILAEPKHVPMYAELVRDYEVEYIAGGATQNSCRVAAALLPEKDAVAFIGCVGRDSYGQQLQDAASTANVQTMYLVDETAQTGTCAVLIKDSERSLVANLSAANNYKPDDHMQLPAVQAAVTSAEFYYVSGFFLTVSPPAIMRVAQHAAKTNKTFMLNLAAPFLCQFFKDPMAAAMPYCDIVFGNESEAEAFAQNNGLADTSATAVAQFIAALPKANATRPRVCCITQGAEFTAVSVGGATAMKFSVTPLPKELIVDTNGAGDAFVGGFLSRYVKGAPLSECVDVGHKTAALIIQQSGCKLPCKSECK